VNERTARGRAKVQHDIPAVRICIPAFNAARTLEHMLESLVHQTYSNIRIAILNNRSTDGTQDIAHGYKARFDNIEVFDFQEHVSAEENFTRCLKLADGSFTALYHADDMYDEFIVEKQVNFLLKHPEVGAVFTAADYIDEHGVKAGQLKFPSEIVSKSLSVFDMREVLKTILRYGNFLPCPSAMARSDIYRNEIAIWNGNRYGTGADLDVWLRILNKHKIGIINEPLLKYRVSNDSFNFRNTRLRTERHSLFRVLDDYVGMNKQFIENRDVDNYVLLQREDDVLVRAMNMVFQNKACDARQLLRSIFATTESGIFLRTSRGRKLLITALITFVISLLPLGDAGRRLLFQLRFRSV
jgi:glycosyltransferase involved in cell wall biosynthesis